MHRQGLQAKQSHAQSMYPDPEASAAQVYSSVTGEQPNNSYDATTYDREDTADHDFLRDTGGNFEQDEQDLSDADSDYLDLQNDIAKFKDSVLKFRATQRGQDDASQEGPAEGHPPRRGRGRRGRGVNRGRGNIRGTIRGPNKAAEPTGDIKLRLSMAYAAFMNQKYEEARDVLEEIIRINAETHEAWMLLASIFKELGDTDNTLKAMIIASSLRPKDVSAWLHCVDIALEKSIEDRAGYVRSAHHCYSSAIRANPKSIEARMGKASLHLEEGNTGRAMSGFEMVLKLSPHNLEVLRRLAEACIEHGTPEKAKTLYQESIKYYRERFNNVDPPFGWSDLNVYVELLACSEQYHDAIRELKDTSRWLLGRETEKFWSQTDDDREWDSDDVRRISCADYVVGAFHLSTYGPGMPLELRVKLGLYRLYVGHVEEAMIHFQYLKAFSETDTIPDYADLFREVADALNQAAFHKQALDFYEPIQKVPELAVASACVAMGSCYLRVGIPEKAEACFKNAIQLEADNFEARVQLAKFYEGLNQQERAFEYVNEAISLKRPPPIRLHRQQTDVDDISSSLEQPTKMPRKPRQRSHLKGHKRSRSAEWKTEEAYRSENLQRHYTTMVVEHDKMKSGDESSSRSWMMSASHLIDDFRGCKTFYPWDKYVHFMGYSGSDLVQAQATLDTDLAAMANRISQSLGAEHPDSSKVPATGIPTDYRGMPFSTWLDIFLEYAVCLARSGSFRESYEICEAAKDAIVFYQSREDMFLIHVCWCTCALIASDEETCVTVARFFMKDYQFTTDSYRMFGALNRLCQSPTSWYNSGPTQKYMLRQIKAMDFSLTDRSNQGKYFAEKGSYSAQDQHGQAIVNVDMDVSLLMLYGFILYSGTSYAYALNYFYRAYALDSSSSIVNLSIGLAYLHLSLKRQADNRQHIISQGLLFMFRYYNNRKQSERILERQEAHYNIARAYHMLGLTNLAISYYIFVLSEADQAGSMLEENMTTDAAYNIQSIYAATGNYPLARAVAEKWLVL
ncbi:hypothetical protein BP6252_07886 [Coleophoma cylindrospora]|uniref:TPR-like protein n=1 Tax=Coleophoma cylindrospora TaxID=1849047 RepID=A0A3D8RB92_9HELO|nr:hypothetical protein BP6252_07886 [Coleophoma cylindrospora]